METDIVNFLPKYPNINPLDDDLLNPYEGNFYDTIYRKKEFYDNKLEKIEDFPTEKGMLLKHQKLIARFFSSYTLYDKLLLVHEMGSGKTCSAIGAIEQIRSENNGFRGVLYLAKGDALINNFINELMFECTDGRYIPKDYDKLSDLEKTHRKKKAIKDYYSMNTFETFAKEISKSSDSDLQKRYNNMIIVIDEVHNLRIQSKETELNIYNQFWRFIHVIRDCKILLLSGTPMKDNVDEIASVMNLFLPENDQLLTGDEFIQEYFNKKDDIYILKDIGVLKLKSVFKGKVSYLKSMESNITRKFVGEKLGKLKHLKVVPDYMSNFQSEKYIQAYKIDKEERQGVYSKSRQACLFVYPDGTYGDEGFTKYIKKTKKGILDEGKKRQLYTYSMTDELKNAIYDKNTDKMLEKLYVFSSKYTESIKNILNARKQGKSVFIYNEFVQGSGLILFSLILELFGFTKASGKEPENSENPRYASLTNLSATTKQLQNLVARFNQPDNLHGKIINVIMGSRKISEGFSLQNIQVEEIHTPWFNYSETAQAIARGYRVGSHRTLIKSGIVPSLDIYQRVSLIKKDVKKSIDLEMYELSEIKDISIKGVERIIKESAWDCKLNYERNHLVGFDGSRECEYMKCDYKCDGISNIVKSSEIDVSTFNLYYNKENIQMIIDEILIIFHRYFKMELKNIIEYFKKYSQFEVITALRTIINESIQITNKYGFPCYLHEQNNVFFLINSLSITGKIGSEYYSEFPNIKKDVAFEEIINPLYMDSMLTIVKSIENSKTEEDIRKVMARLPKKVREFFIEGSILAQNKNIKKNKNIRGLILKYFENYFEKIDDKWVSWLLYDDTEIIRCLEKDDTWKDCDEEYLEKFENRKNKLQEDIEKNPYKYYGQFSKETNEFCIRDVEQIAEKKNQRTSGKRCTNWKKQEILPVVINKLKIPIPKDSLIDSREMKKWKKIDTTNKTKLLSEISKNKYVKEYADSKLSIDELRRILFWGTQQIKPMCSYIREWFNSKNLLVEDPDCGKMGKVKI